MSGKRWPWREGDRAVYVFDLRPEPTELKTNPEYPEDGPQIFFPENEIYTVKDDFDRPNTDSAWNYWEKLCGAKGT